MSSVCLSRACAKILSQYVKTKMAKEQCYLFVIWQAGRQIQPEATRQPARGSRVELGPAFQLVKLDDNVPGVQDGGGGAARARRPTASRHATAERQQTAFGAFLKF